MTRKMSAIWFNVLNTAMTWPGALYLTLLRQNMAYCGILLIDGVAGRGTDTKYDTCTTLSYISLQTHS